MKKSSLFLEVVKIFTVGDRSYIYERSRAYELSKGNALRNVLRNSFVLGSS